MVNNTTKSNNQEPPIGRRLDSHIELRKFRWSDPLRTLDKKHEGNDSLLNALNAYSMYLRCLIVIWHRLIQDFEIDSHLYNLLHKQIYSHLGMHTLSSKERDLVDSGHTSELVLQIDYESFLIFACIMMDKIPRIAAALLSEDRNIVTNSFDKHKKYFLEPKRISYPLNEDYAKLIRERTEWFDMSLVLARDKLVTHGGTYGIALTRRRKTAGIRMDKIKIGEAFTKEAHQIIQIKKKYENKYPDLATVEDNLWEIMHFFMNHDINLDKNDKGNFVNIVHKTGGSLPKLTYLFQKIMDFLERFDKIFEP